MRTADRKLQTAGRGGGCATSLALSLLVLSFLPLASGCHPAIELSPSDLTIWGGHDSSENGKFSSPRAITVGPSDEVYVIDETGRVQVFTCDGVFKRLWRMPSIENGNPEAIWATPANTVYVADTHYSQIIVYSATGEILRKWGSYGSQDGQFIYPVGVVVNSAGETFVCEYGESDRVQKFAPDAKLLAKWGRFGAGEYEFNRPSGLALDSDGNLYVADAVNHRIYKFTGDGELLLTWGKVGNQPGELKYPYDVAVGPQGNVYVCEYGNNRVQKFTSDGNPLASWGTAGRGPGQLAAPWGVAVDPAGNVYVADTGNHRVQKFRL